MRELEGVELEIAVADKVMGWPCRDDNSLLRESTYVTCKSGMSHTEIALYKFGVTPSDQGWWSPLRSMSDAWEVSDRLHALGYQLDLGNFRPGEATESHNWHAKFSDGKCTASFGYGLTAGEAICRAALAAVQEGETE